MGKLGIARYKGESFVLRIGGRVIAKVTVTDVRGNKIKIGFDADDSLEINRLELDKSKHPEDYTP